MTYPIEESRFAEEVLGASVPVLVNFWAPWCGLCRLIEPLLHQFQRDWGPQVKLVSVNADDNLKLANTYRLTQLPTLILFENGQPVDRLDAIGGREEMRRALNALMLKRLKAFST